MPFSIEKVSGKEKTKTNKNHSNMEKDILLVVRC